MAQVWQKPADLIQTTIIKHILAVVTAPMNQFKLFTDFSYRFCSCKKLFGLTKQEQMRSNSSSSASLQLAEVS